MSKSQKIPVDVETLRTVFDALSSSMDFGSGFLDTPEVVALRDLADVLELDPILATPESQVADFYEEAPEAWGDRYRWYNEKRKAAGGY